MNGLVSRIGRLKAARWWDVAESDHNWWTSDQLSTEIDARISSVEPGGVPGALAEAFGSDVVGTAISVGAGAATKEIRLLELGRVEHFTTYEISTSRASSARQAVHERGLDDRMDVRVGDAFREVDARDFDLVYWDHSLHHMMDVRAALEWSAHCVRKDGAILVNDYVGPARLSWTHDQVDRANEFLRELFAEGLLESPDHRPIRYRRWFDRVRLRMRDPTEAPQSPLIPAAFHATTSSSIRYLGGALIHLCAPILLANGCTAEVLDRLVSADRAWSSPDNSHFGFGLVRIS